MSVEVIGGGDYIAPQVADPMVWKTQILCATVRRK
jgi:hypothetical protein